MAGGVDVATLRTRVIADIKQFEAGMLKAQASATKFTAATEASMGKVVTSSKAAAAQSAVSSKEMETAHVTATTRMMRASKRAAPVIGKGLKKIALPAALAGAAATKMAFDYDTSMQKIKNLVGVGDKQMAQFTKQVKELAPTVAKSPQELADALFFITSAGLKGSKAMDTLTMSAKASEIGLGETKVVADAVTSAMNAYSKEGLSAADATNILALTVKRGKAEASDFAPVLGNLLPLSEKMGVSFNDVGAALATMTRTGMDVHVAATGIQAFFSSILKGTPASEKALKKVGLSTEKLREVVKEQGLLEAMNLLKERMKGNNAAFAAAIPNIRALRGVLNIIGQDSKITGETFKILRKNTDIVGKGFENVSKRPAKQFQEALAEIKTSAVKVGESLAPTMAKISKNVAATTQHFDALTAAEVGVPAAITLALTRSVKLSALVGGIAANFSTAAQHAKNLANVQQSLSDWTEKVRHSTEGVKSADIVDANERERILGLARLTGDATEEEVNALDKQITKYNDIVKKKLAIQKIEQSRQRGTEVARQVIADEGRITKSTRGIIESFRLLPPEASREAKKAMLAAIQSAEKYGELPKGTSKKIEHSFSDSYRYARIHAENELRRLHSQANKVSESTASDGKKSAHDWRVANAHEISRMVANQSTQMSEYEKTTRKSLSRTGRNVNKMLEIFGQEPIKINLSAEAKGRGGIVKRQRGGYAQHGFLPGTGRQDTVPVMAAPGEAFLTQHQAAVVDRSLKTTEGYGLPSLFRRESKAHAAGGSKHTPGFKHGGIVALGRSLQRQGFLVGENPAFGGVTPGVHVKGSLHYSGKALDINWVPADQEPAKLDALNRLLRSEGWHTLWRVAGHFDHLHVDTGGGIGGTLSSIMEELVAPEFTGPAGSLKSILEGSAKITTKAANKFLRHMLPTEGVEPGAGELKGSLRDMVTRRARARKWSPTDWLWIINRESGGSTSARNPSSGAFGIGQLLPQTYARYGGGPGSSMAEQVLAMEHYIADRYGSTTSARGFWEAHNWYRGGGIVGFQHGGKEDKKRKGKRPKTRHSHKLHGKHKARGKHHGGFHETPIEGLKYQAKRAREYQEAVENRMTTINTLQQQYDNAQRAIDLTDETYILTDAEGREILNLAPAPADVSDIAGWVRQNPWVKDTNALADPVTGAPTRGIPQAIAEFWSLVDQKNAIIGVVANRWNVLQDMRDYLTAGLKERHDEIDRLNKAAAKDRKKIEHINDEIKKRRKKIRKEKKKKKPNQKRIKKWQKEIDDLHKERDPYRRDLERIVGSDEYEVKGGVKGRVPLLKAGSEKWGGWIDEYTDEVTPGSGSYVPNILEGLDLDVKELGKSISDAAGTHVTVPEEDTSLQDALDQQKIDALEEQTRNLERELAVSQAQFEIFKDFPGLASGTPFVQRGGLAELHRGEAVIPEPFNPFEHGGGLSGGPITIKLDLTDAPILTEVLKQVDARIEGSGDVIVEMVSAELGSRVGLGIQSAGTAGQVARITS